MPPTNRQTLVVEKIKKTPSLSKNILKWKFFSQKKLPKIR